jgi:hypothetical protein
VRSGTWFWARTGHGAEFEAEPTGYRWIFCRDGGSAGIQVLRLGDRDLPDEAGTLIWSLTLCERTWQVAGFPVLDAIRCPGL